MINFWKISIVLNFWRKILRIFFQFRLFSTRMIFTYWLMTDVQYRCKRRILFLSMIECVLHISSYVFRKFETFFLLNEKAFWVSEYEKFWKRLVNSRLIRFRSLIRDVIEAFESSDEKISIDLFLYALKLFFKFTTELTNSRKSKTSSTKKKSLKKKSWHRFQTHK